MKTNILKVEMDKRKLQEAIDIFEGVNGTSAYLFMNKDTMNAITPVVVKECEPFVSVSHNIEDFGKLAIYQGNKCFVDNDLPFGEVEIR